MTNEECNLEEFNWQLTIVKLANELAYLSTMKVAISACVLFRKKMFYVCPSSVGLN